MSIGEVKEFIYGVCDTLETGVLGPTVGAARTAYAERNVLRVGLGDTSRQELTQTVDDLSTIFDDLESCGDRLQLVIQELRAYANGL